MIVILKHLGHKNDGNGFKKLSTKNSFHSKTKMKHYLVSVKRFNIYINIAKIYYYSKNYR